MPARPSLFVGPLIVSLIAFVWLMTLSSWLGFRPGNPLASRSDVLFDSDAGRVARALTLPMPLVPRAVHPFESFVWSPLTRMLDAGLRVIGLDAGGTRAPRAVVAAVAGLGFGAIYLLARTFGTPPVTCWLLLVPCLFATVNVVAAMPDHFGLSSGLLAISCALIEARQWPRLRVAGLVAGAAAAGTTVTNAVFLALSGARAIHRRRRVAWALGWGGAALITVALATVGRTSVAIDEYVRSYTHNRLLEDPGKAALYIASTVITPMVGPLPSVQRIGRGVLMVTYEPLDFGRYTRWQIAGVAVWLAMLGVGLTQLFREEPTRPVAAVLVSWLIFNAAFHSVWGGEQFLYSPHWAWALMAIVMMGLKRMPAAWIAAAILPLIVAQLTALSAIRSAIASIPN